MKIARRTASQIGTWLVPGPGPFKKINKDTSVSVLKERSRRPRSPDLPFEPSMPTPEIRIGTCLLSRTPYKHVCTARCSVGTMVSVTRTGIPLSSARKSGSTASKSRTTLQLPVGSRIGLIWQFPVWLPQTT